MTDERSSHKENENDACEGCVENLSLNRKRELIVAEFKRKHKVRSIFRDFPVDELSEIVDRLKGVLDERIKEEAEREAKEAEKQARARLILQDMENQGIDFEVLQQVRDQQSQHHAGGSSKTKYIKDGVSWTGQGRRPAPFKGLSDFELEKHRVS